MIKFFTVFFSLIYIFTFSAKASFWVRAEGPYGGNTPCIEADKNDILYAGTDCGVYKSTDMGSSWYPCNNGIDSYSILSIAIKQTGEIIAAAKDHGLYISNDNGATWKFITSGGIHNEWAAVTISPTGDIWTSSPGKDIMYSQDNGTTWNTIEINANCSYTSAIAFDKSGNIYAGAMMNDSIPYAQLYRSTDYGKTWEALMEDDWITYFHILCIGFNKNGHILVGDATTLRFSLSRDGGKTWIENDGRIWGSAPSSFLMLEDGTLFCTAINGVFKSTDGGEYWTFTNNNYSIQRMRDIAVVSTGRLFISCINNGLYYSDDVGETWKECNKGIAFNRITCIEENDNGFCFASTDYNGLYRSSDNGRSWEKVIGYWNFRNVASSSNGIVYATSSRSTYKSTDNGLTWREFYKYADPQPYDIIDLGNGNYISACSPGVCHSSNYGENWNEIKTGITGATYGTKIIRDNDGYLYTLLLYGIIRSTDNGNSWQSITSSTDPLFFSDFAVSPRNYIVAASNLNILIFDDTSPENKLVFTAASEVTAVQVDNTGTIYAATQSNGVFKSEDDGKTWTELNDGMPKSTLTSMIITNDNHLLAAGNEGVFLSGEELSRYNTSDTPGFAWIYPDPVKDHAIVSFASGTKAEYIEILNTFGSTIRAFSLTDQEKAAGKIDILLNDLNPGVYLVSMDNGINRQSSKFVKSD